MCLMNTREMTGLMRPMPHDDSWLKTKYRLTHCLLDWSVRQLKPRRLLEPITFKFFCSAKHEGNIRSRSGIEPDQVFLISNSDKNWPKKEKERFKWKIQTQPVISWAIVFCIMWLTPYNDWNRSIKTESEKKKIFLVDSRWRV